MRIWFNKNFSSIHAVLRNLRHSNNDSKITLVFSHPQQHAPGMAIADECYLEPDDLNNAEYLEWAIRFCRQQRINLLWPGKAAILFIENRARFAAEGVQIVAVAEANILELLHDKARFYQLLDDNIARLPETVTVNTLDEFDQAYATLRQKHEKLCVKPSQSVFGLGFRVIDEQRDSVTHLLSGIEYQIPLQALRAGMAQAQPFGDLLVMEYLNGHEWSVDCAASNGQLWCAVQRKKPLQAGRVQMIDNHPEIAGMVERLTRHFSLNGLFNIQFKQGKDGPRLLEINPRPSGGVGMAMLSGANLATIALQAIKKQNPPTELNNTRIAYGRYVAEVNMPQIMEDF
jgi:carbamoylphosphate synthase large subunit